MSLKHSLTRIVALTATLLVACGDEVTEVTEVHETGMKIVEKGEKLPKCTTENEGTMVYALDSAAAYLCINRDWTSFNGKDGADGKDGRDGKDGEDGAKGDKGDQGVKGESGIGCSLTDNGDGTVSVVCGDSTTTINKAVCGETPYDPAKQFCDSRDNKVYRHVTIGKQTWMAENLNYVYIGVPFKTGDYTSDSTSWCYDNDPAECTKSGRLYTWSAAMDSTAVFSNNAKGCGYSVECTVKFPARGICPAGWHIPDTTEWKTLYSAMGKSAYAMQAKGFEGWPDATDAFGFSALPAGARSFEGVFFSDVEDRSFICFWSAVENTTARAHNWGLLADGAGIDVCDFKNDGYSVRCIKDSAE